MVSIALALWLRSRLPASEGGKVDYRTRHDPPAHLPPDEDDDMADWPHEPRRPNRRRNGPASASAAIQARARAAKMGIMKRFITIPPWVSGANISAGTMPAG